MENTTFEQAVEMVKALPSEDRERFIEWFNRQEQLDATADKHPVTEIATMPAIVEKREERFQRALQWLDKNKPNYLGQWVALDGDHLLAAGTDGKQVYAQAVAAGVASPLLQQIKAEDDLPFGGW